MVENWVSCDVPLNLSDIEPEYIIYSILYPQLYMGYPEL